MHKWTIYACHCVDTFTFKLKSAFGFKMNWRPIKSVRLLNWRGKLLGGGKPSPSLILDNRGTQNFWRGKFRQLSPNKSRIPHFILLRTAVFLHTLTIYGFQFFYEHNMIFVSVGRESRSSMACDVNWLKIGTAKAAHEVLSQNDDKATVWGE